MNRALDVAGASLGLALASPFLAAAALAIKLVDRGPVLYRQRRVGKDGREFELVKLRTMVVGAEQQGAAGRSIAATRGSRAVGRAAAAALAGRAASALERRARRDEPDRAAADARVPGRAVHAAAAEAARREAGDHRLGADPRPRVAALGGADRARRLVRREPLAGASTSRSCCARRARSSAARTRARRAAGGPATPEKALIEGTLHLLPVAIVLRKV